MLDVVCVFDGVCLLACIIVCVFLLLLLWLVFLPLLTCGVTVIDIDGIAMVIVIVVIYVASVA